MNTFIVTALLAAAAPQGTALELGLKREVTLLVGEEEALRRELEQLQTLRAARVAGLQREIAALEVETVEASTRAATARAALEAAGATSPSSTALPEERAAMTEAMRLLELGTSSSEAPGTGEPLVDELEHALGRLERRTAPQTIESGFFGPDGTWLQGKVVRLGDVGVAAAATVAGPLLPTGDGSLLMASSSPALAQEAARQVVSGAHASLWPLSFGDPDEAGTGPGTVGASTIEKLERLGSGAVVVLVALLLGVGGAVATAVAAARRHRAVAAIAGRLVGLVSSGETVAAAALARTVGGVTGRFLIAVIAVVGRATPEDEVAALSAEATAALLRPLQLIRGGLAIVAAVVVVVAAFAVDGALSGAMVGGALSPPAVVAGLGASLLPLQWLAVAAVPAVIAVFVAEVTIARTRELLEVTALRVLDAAQRGR